MKRIKVITSVSEFEDFVNSDAINVIKTDVTGVQQSFLCQECFIAVVYYEEQWIKTEETKPWGTKPLWLAVSGEVIEGFYSADEFRTPIKTDDGSEPMLSVVYPTHWIPKQHKPQPPLQDKGQITLEVGPDGHPTEEGYRTLKKHGLEYVPNKQNNPQT